MLSHGGDFLQILETDGETHPPVQTSIIATTFPSELLFQLFTIATIANDLPNLDFRDVLHLTHVCARWRTVVLDYPTLWSQLSSTMPGDIARWFLQRSQQVLLQVYLGIDFTNDSVNEDTSQGVCHTILDGVLRQASRVETLYLCPTVDSSFFLPNSIQDPASHFTHLRSITIRLTGFSTWTLARVVKNYSDFVFIARAPSLSHLALWATLICPPKIDADLDNVDASILSRIKHLEIGSDNIGYSSQLTFLHRIGLGKMLNLVCLELSISEQHDDNADWLSTEALGSFPRLTLLALNAPPSTCTYFLTTIITPPTTCLRIVCLRPKKEARLGPLMKLICSRLDDQHRLRSLVLDGSRAYDYHISGWIEAGHSLFGHHAPAIEPPQLDLKLPWQKSPRGRDTYAEGELASCMEVLRDSSLGHVETLTIRVLKNTRTDWPSFLRLAVGVRVLKIWSNGHLSKLVNALCVKSGEVLLPALQSLQIAEGTEIVLSGEKAEATAKVLLRCVKTRKDAGVPVDELVFERLSGDLREEVMSNPLVDEAKLTWL